MSHLKNMNIRLNICCVNWQCVHCGLCSATNLSLCREQLLSLRMALSLQNKDVRVQRAQ